MKNQIKSAVVLAALVAAGPHFSNGLSGGRQRHLYRSGSRQHLHRRHGFHLGQHGVHLQPPASRPRAQPARRYPSASRSRDCDTALSGVKVKFDGAADTSNTSLLEITTGIDAATGIAIQVRDEDGTAVAMNSESKEYTLGSDNATLDFDARYISTSSTVEAGEANATASFELQYR